MGDSKVKVILMGKGSLAIEFGQWFHESTGHELVAVVPVVPEPRWSGSLIDWAGGQGIPRVESGHYRDIPESVASPYDLVFSVFYDRIIRQSFIDRCKRILNLHNGPLPRYRGVSPVNWALKNGETEHGVTIHEITRGIDDGPIVSQVKFSIYPETDEVIDVYQRCLAHGRTLFEQTMPMLDAITPRSQDEAQATYYSLKENALLGERSNFTRGESGG